MFSFQLRIKKKEKDSTKVVNWGHNVDGEKIHLKLVSAVSCRRMVKKGCVFGRSDRTFQSDGPEELVRFLAHRELFSTRHFFTLLRALSLFRRQILLQGRVPRVYAPIYLFTLFYDRSFHSPNHILCSLYSEKSLRKDLDSISNLNKYINIK
jgi:hypothetical protein